MMFRRLYWVTEQIDAQSSQVTGVYTSIPDLIRKGLDMHGKDFRLTLTKLDCSEGRLGSWQSPAFEGLEERLQDFVATDEFSQEHCSALVEELRKRSAASV
jgi:hypothetical protein